MFHPLEWYTACRIDRIWVLTFGIGEETGWRGYALPRLQKDRSALSATVIL
jgi:membrane protease YdiL (CAAX protease family)